MMPIAAVLVVLSIGLNALLSSFYRDESDQTVMIGSLRMLFSGYKPEDIDRIEISHPNGTEHLLVRNPGGWEIREATVWSPISAERARGLFHDTGGNPEIRGEMPVFLQGANPANHERVFGVMPFQGPTVRFYSEGSLVEQFIVGRKAMRNNQIGTFLRRPSENYVYLAAGDLGDNFSGDSVRFWRVRSLNHGIDAASVEEIRVIGPTDQRSYTIRRAGSRWEVETAEGWRPARTEAVRNTLRELLQLEAQDFLDENDEVSINPPGKPVATVTVFLAGVGQPREIKLWAETQPGSALWVTTVTDSPGVKSVFWPFAVMRPVEDFLISSPAVTEVTDASPSGPAYGQ